MELVLALRKPPGAVFKKEPYSHTLYLAKTVFRSVVELVVRIFARIINIKLSMYYPLRQGSF